MSCILEVTGLCVDYGSVQAVKGIDFTLEPAKITTLLGANGAGKSTTLMALSGLLKSAGAILFEGEDLTRLAPHEIVERRLIHIPEGRQILTGLSVRENLVMGAYRRRDRSAIPADIEEMLSLFPRLAERLDRPAGNLSGGEQQMLAIARGLMARPRLLLLDEPSMGLAPRLVSDIFKVLASLTARGLTLFLVEQNVRQALKIADYAYVMENGSIVLCGSSAELLHNPQIIDAYLGGQRAS